MTIHLYRALISYSNQDTRYCVMQPSTASADTQCVFTGTKKMLFSDIRSSIVTKWKLTSFAVETQVLYHSATAVSCYLINESSSALE